MLNHRLSASGDYLRACSAFDTSVCVSNSSTTVFVESYGEEQDLCFCLDDTTTISLLGYEITLDGTPSGSSIESLFESITRIGSVSVEEGNVVSGASCGCASGSAQKFGVTFNTLMGDVPLVGMSSGSAVETVKGQTQFVQGVADYSVMIPHSQIDFQPQVFVRVSAANSIGFSSFIAPKPARVVLYDGVPTPVMGINVVPASSSELLVSWTPLAEFTDSGLLYTQFDVEIDTSPAFSSRCTSKICEALTSFPIAHLVNMNTTMSEYMLTHLVPGVPYYVRIKACYNVSIDDICSPYSFFGYPSSPIAVAPGQVPPVVGTTAVTVVDSSTLAFDWTTAETRSEGLNGHPITNYTIQLSSPVSKVLKVVFVDASELFSGKLRLKDTTGTASRCISLSATAFELEVKIEELPSVDIVTVVLDEESSTSSRRVFHVTFASNYGDEPELMYSSSCSDADAQSVEISTVTEGEVSFVPDVYKLVTSSQSELGGYYDLRYGFKGDMVKLLFNENGDATVTVSIEAGQRSFVADSSVSHLLAPGVIVRVGDEDVRVETVSDDGMTVTFFPYHTNEAEDLDVVVSETLIGTATVDSSTTLATTWDLRNEISVGDSVLMMRAETGDSTIVDSQTLTVQSITQGSIVVVEAIVVSGSGPVALYRQKNVLVRFDARPEELDSAVESLSQVGSVSVERFGPTLANGFTWYLTFTSIYGDTLTCPEGSSCLKAFDQATAAMSVAGLAGSDADLNGYYISDSFVNGRRKYLKLNSPYSMQYNDDSLAWEFLANDALVLQDLGAGSSAMYPEFTGATITFPEDALALETLLTGTASSLSLSLVQEGSAPSFDHVVAAHVLTEQLSEVQSVSVVTSDGLLFGGFNLDFNDSGIAVYFRADESAADFETKLESLPTVGDVAVTRSLVADNDTSAFLGFEWLITFVSQKGDVPLMKYELVVPYGLDISGNGLEVEVAEVSPGLSLPLVDYFDGLNAGQEYSVEIFASNSFGAGESSTTVQNDGEGVVPMSFPLVSISSPPDLVSVSAMSSSQVEVVFTPPAHDGGDAIQRYVVEYTTDVTEGLAVSSTLRFRIYNRAGNDSLGYWRLMFHETATTLLPWAAEAEEVRAAVDALASTEGVEVSRETVLPKFGEGFEYVVELNTEIGALAQGNVTIDISLLSSGSLTDDFVVEILSRGPTTEPANYDAQWIYADCSSTGIGAASEHQVISIQSAEPDTYGDGSFRLSLGSESTECIPFDVSTDALKLALEALKGAKDVYVEDHKRSTGADTPAFRDFHVFFEGVYQELDWPSMRADQVDDGTQTWETSLYAESCSPTTLSSTSVTVFTVNDKMACAAGVSDLQVVVLESSGDIGGYFYLYLMGEKTGALTFDAAAAELETELNGLSSVSGVSVTRFNHFGAPYSGFAWVVTFPVEMGDVEAMVADDQHITGVDAAVNVYPLLNITTTADNDDMSGHFQIRIGSEETVPLSYDATDSTVLSALHNLTNVAKASMIGLRDYESYSSISFNASVLDNSTATSMFSVSANTTTRVAHGDRVMIPGIDYVGFIIDIVVVDSGRTDFYLNSSFTPAATNFEVQIGTVKLSKKALPGLVSLEAVTQVYNATSNSSTIVTYDMLTSGSTYYFDGFSYSVVSSDLCSRVSDFYCSELDTEFTGDEVIMAHVPMFVFEEFVELHTTVNWALSIDDFFWIGDFQLQIASVPLEAANQTRYTVSGGSLRYPFEAAVAFEAANGLERVIVFKSITDDVNTARVTLESDWRGTNVQVFSQRSDGVAPGTFRLGGASQVQTVTFRSTSAEISTSQLGKVFQLSFGPDTASNFTYGADANEWKNRLETMLNVGRVSVERTGDGSSAMWSYGYVYTIYFWGAYGTQTIPQLSSEISNLTDIEVRHDTVREPEFLPDYSARYIALDEAQQYTMRMRAINSYGISEPSESVIVNTERHGGLPGTPQSVVLGQYRSGESLSLSFATPQFDGGLPITTYLVETDSTSSFDPGSEDYRSLELSVVPEVQQITTYFRAADNVKTRGGSFTLTFGGRTSAPLAFDISAFDLEIALNQLVGTRHVASPPVTVTRSNWNRGYRWLVNFKGIPGDVGLLLVDYTMLLGDDARMDVQELTKGRGDIVPGEFVFEVQTVRTQALSAISGTFVLNMQGYNTLPISYNETAVSLKQKLEYLPTIFTVNVDREVLSRKYDLYAWTITFTHMRKEVVQGAGNLPPLTVSSQNLAPTTSAAVEIFEVVKGSHPFKFDLTDLDTHDTQYARVTSYNERGYSLQSVTASKLVLGQPSAPSTSSMTVRSGTSLTATWSADATDPSVDGFKVEYYTSVPIPEVQVITTSSSGSLSEIQRLTVEADEENLAGYFRLEFGGETTDNIRWNANAAGEESVAQALARLSTMGTVEVDRQLSRIAVPGLKINGTYGDSFVTATKGSAASLSRGDIIWISGEQFTIDSVADPVINLESNFTVSTLEEVGVFVWSYGYSWDITFTNQIGDLPLILAKSSDNWAGTNPVIKIDPIRNGVAPLSGTFRVGYRGSMTDALPHDISAEDMKIALERLDTLAEVSVTRFSNGFGFDWRITFLSEVGDVPSLYVNDAALTGLFARAAAVATSAGETPDHYGSFFVSGSTARSTNITGLTLGVPYQVRVSAHNEQGFSYPAVTAFVAPKMRPSVPYNATMFALSPTQLKLVWQTPINTGGSVIQRYRVEWDLTADFQNVALTGNTREIPVTPSSGPTYCYNIDIPAASSNLPRFARIFAYNGFEWSFAGYPNPRSANGEIGSPGAPLDVQVIPTDAVGLLVSWDAPNSNKCEYGGDGGTPVTHYVVEWDTREDFGSPADRVTLYELEHLSFWIGGRDFMTGERSTLLAENTPYYVRVTAFNKRGAGVAGFANGATSTSDQPPLAPANLTVSSIGPTSLFMRWDRPERDGGASLEYYRLEYSTNSSFPYYEKVDLPLISEVQTIVAETDVVIEEQAVRVLVEVTNEVQVVRSEVNGTDEIQTITTTCDDVTNEVQRIVTTAIDIDEVQKVELTGTDVDEVQLVQTRTDDLPEIQMVEVISPRVDSVQIVGAIVSNVDTSACTQGQECPDQETKWEGHFRLQFNPNKCGTDADDSDSNWCKVALDTMGITGYDCSETSCLTDFLPFDGNATALQEQLCNLKGSGATTFMQDGNGTCVEVAKWSETLEVGTEGAYLLAYNVTFVGDTLRGKVPAMQVMFSNVSHTSVQGQLSDSYDNDGVVLTVGNITTEGEVYVLVEGNQPEGLISLSYTCEARTVSTNVTVSSSSASRIGDTVTVPSNVTLELFQFIRIDTSYHQIVSLSSGQVGTIEPTFITNFASLILNDVSDTYETADGEYGVFYSDPTEQYGVSEACQNQRIYETSTISPVDIILDIKTKLRALSDVINDHPDAIEVSRDYYPPHADFVGYRWTITFFRQNGDLKPLTCDDSDLSSTNTEAGAVCVVSTVQEGSLLDGNFSLGISFPHVYVGPPVNYTADSVPWNIDATHLGEVLSENNFFGTVTVTRVSYSPTGHIRWSGGYLWTITFTERNGDLPLMAALNDFTVTSAKNISLEVGSQRSPLTIDDPGSAVEGNQVVGTYGFSVFDTEGRSYNSTSSFIPVANSTTGQALSAEEYQTLLIELFDGQEVVNVTRSTLPNAVMGYTYTIQFIGQIVGGNMPSLVPSTDSISATATASTALQVGELCANENACSLNSYVVVVDVQVTESIIGAQLQGAFQLVYDGFSTGAIPYNAEAVVVERSLNDLPSISPSRVRVSRDGDLRTPDNQVFGYVWSITFTSNTWADPTINHDEYIEGNWIGSATTRSDTWPSGYSKAWGRNVGDVPLISCSSGSLFVTNGLLPTDGCVVQEVVKGTPPLSGSFSLTLDTTGHEVINIQDVLQTASISHNAFANVTQSGGDGSSVEEKLEALTSVGDVTVTRSEVNPRNGGYTWWITFLRDDSSAGGQFGDDCEQRDTFDNLCNAPGDVPSLTFNLGTLDGACRSALVEDTYNCTLITILTGDSNSTDEPPGSKSVQRIYLDNENYDSAFDNEQFYIELLEEGMEPPSAEPTASPTASPTAMRRRLQTTNNYRTDCLPVTASAAMLQNYIHDNISSLNPELGSRGVDVTEGTDTVRARNGKVFFVYFFDEGYHAPFGVFPCTSNVDWTISQQTIVNGSVFGMTAEQAGVINGVVQRGDFIEFYVFGDEPHTTNLKWNTLPEGTDALSNVSIKSYLESISDRRVNVTREVVGKYGVVQYCIRFVFNPGNSPPGAGNVPLLVVTQEAAIDGNIYEPQVFEKVQGSTGLSGTFLIDLNDPDGPRNVSFSETATRLERKLEELTTIENVEVHRFQFPSPTTGGWGDASVEPGTLGGYEWRIFFVRNTGAYNGFSFPPGSGNIDPLTVTFNTGVNLFGSAVQVLTLNNVDGSTPIDGSFTVALGGERTDAIAYNQQPLAVKYMLEALHSVGEVETDGNLRVMEQIPGVTASVSRDSFVLTLEYDTSDEVNPPDIRQMIAPGDIIRIGGAADGAANSQSSIDGAEFFHSVSVAAQSPIVSTGGDAPMILPGEILRIGADNYTVIKAGSEVQTLSVSCADSNSTCGGFSVSFFHSGDTASSLCVVRGTGEEMTSAADLQASLEAMVNIGEGNVIVTRSHNYDSTAFVFYVYFVGETVKGDVNPLIVTSGCAASVPAESSYSALAAGSKVTSFTAVQGGFTEVQRIRVNVEAGYINGGMFKLVATSPFSGETNTTDSCIAFGAEASELENALKGLYVLTNQPLPFKVSISSDSDHLYMNTTSSVFGIIEVGSVLAFPLDRGSTVTVEQVIDSNTFVTSITSLDFLVTNSSEVYEVELVHEQAVQVARYGTGNSTSTMMTVTQTADSFVYADSGGFFRLRMIMNGVEKRSPQCLAYHSSAQEVQTAINSMEFDFNGDGFYSELDDDHVKVMREGDGSVTSGYGYTYTLRFAGPELEFVRSEVLGFSEPFLQIIDEGHFGGCNDLNGTVRESVQIDYTQSISSTTWVTATIDGLQESTLGSVQPGDHIRLPGSANPYKTYKVLATTEFSITVDTALPPSSGTAPSTLDVFVIHSAVPEYTVKTVQQGEDSYSYEIFFTGAHLSNVAPLSPLICAEPFQQFDGMRYDVQVRTNRNGGSDEVQEIRLFSTAKISSQDGSLYWKLVRDGQTVIPNTTAGGFQWGADESTLTAALTTAVGSSVEVSRTGLGSEQEMFSYVYQITFTSYDSNGDVPQLAALTDGGVSPAKFSSGNSSVFASTLDDLTTSGSFNGSADTTFVVKINSTGDSADSFSWATGAAISQFTTPRSIVSQREYLLANGVYIMFGSSTGHQVGDSWTFTGVRTTDELPEGATVSSYLVLSGTPITDEITLAKGYKGEGTGAAASYLVAPIYTVQDQTVDVFQLTTNSHAELGNLSYRFSVQSNSGSLLHNVSECIAWDAPDYVVEKALDDAFYGLCGDATEQCVTVARSTDEVNNADGFVYRIYFENEIFYKNLYRHSFFVNQSGCNSSLLSEDLVLTKIQTAVNHEPFTIDQLPLATMAASNVGARFLGQSKTNVPLYKVNGNFWAVTFTSNVGDISALTVAPTKYLTDGTELTVYDNVVQGVHPLSHIVSDLNTGIEYSARVKAYTRGPNRGYSAYAISLSGSDINDSSDVPSGVPPIISNFVAEESLRVNELQEVVVAAAHLNEVQTITTSAAEYPEVQEITLTAPEGYTVDGKFALRFPEIQTIHAQATTTSAMSGYFQLVYHWFDLPDSLNASTACLSVTASAAEVETALETLDAIDDVEVVRSGYGGYTDYFGYRWEVSFVGNMVAGNVRRLEVLYGESAGSCSGAVPSDLSLFVETENEGEALGLDTEIQEIVISADTFFVEGSYKLTFDGESTSCIPWNASALQLEAALEDLSGIDYVLVERTGSGSFASNYGFAYSVYFTGNGLHQRDQAASPLSLLTPVLGDNDCIDFAYFTEGVLVQFSVEEATVNTTRSRVRGFNLDTAGTTAAVLAEELALMPSFVNIYDVRRSLSDDRLGFKWTVVFDLSMGDAPPLVCGMDSTLVATQGICSHSTVTQGNFIGGYFIVGTSKLLPSDVSAVTMQNELQRLYGFGNVSVSRSDADNQGGYTWTVTWLTVEGDVPALTFSSSLTGSAVKVVGATIQDGNFLSGSFILEYNGQVTPAISYDASAADVQAALQHIVGEVSVVKRMDSTEGGGSYLVSFLALSGDVPSLIPQYQGTLFGVGAVVKVNELEKGALALGSSVKLSFESALHCSQSQVLKGSCGQPVDFYTVEVGDSRGNVEQVITIDADYSTQIIRVAAPSFYDTLYYVGEDATGFFQLSYNGATTGPISAHASAQDLRDALEALTDIHTLRVRRSNSAELLEGAVAAVPGQQSLTCVSSSCSFSTLTAGDLVRVGGIWYRVSHLYAGSTTELPLATANDSSVVTFYAGSEDLEAPLYRWARGFEWTVSFLSVEGSEVLPLSSPVHGLNPSDATVSIRPADCIACMYVNGLSVLQTYYLNLKAHNSKGFGDYASTTGVPREIPGPPNAVSAKSISGSQLEVLFSPPSGVVSDITQYSVEWDTNEDFTNVTTGNPSCSTSGFGRCELVGAALSVVPPYRYLINFLSSDTLYYIRVAARNSISFADSAEIENPTRWSQVVYAVTQDQAPSTPIAVESTVAGLTSLQVLITPPVSNGGLNFTQYLIEWDASEQFDDVSTYGSDIVDPADLPLLSDSSGILVYNLEGLITGVSYWVRVSAANAIGSGPVTSTPSSSTPAGKALAPTSVFLSTASSQDTSIDSTTVSWTAPSGAVPDGGSPITGYLIEWWEGGAVNEVQEIQFTSETFPIFRNGQFLLSFGPEPGEKEITGTLTHTASAYNVRSELMNLGYATGLTNNFSFPQMLGDVRVQRSTITGKGYRWVVTFTSELNRGDQVSLLATSLASDSDGEALDVIEVVSGQRSGGFSEVQKIVILASGTNDTTDLGGWFRLSFNGSLTQTVYLPSSATSAQVQQALQQLSTLRTVTVTRSNVYTTRSGVNLAGFEWTIVFSGDIGNQPALVVDDDLLFTTRTAVVVTVYDGDNSLTVSGDKVADTFPGEAPQNYNARTVDRDSRSYTIEGLVPGNTYFVAVSAINSYGVGQSTLPVPDSTTPPKQVPQPPTDVTVDVHPGSATSLDVTFDEPLSDGGSEILSYRIELDITTSFLDPIHTVIPCYADSTRSVFQITTAGFPGDPLVGGYFNLTLARNRASFVSDYIPYDATATLADEEGVSVAVGGLSAIVSSGSNKITTSNDPTELLFVNDRLQFTSQRYDQEIFTVTNVNGTVITLDKAVQLESLASVSSAVYRVSGGKGLTTNSKVSCTSDASLCRVERRQRSGSIEGKLESIPEALVLGVSVDKDEPDIYNGVTWRVTFLDDSFAGSLNFNLDVTEGSNFLVTENGNRGNVTVTKIQDGVTYGECVGTHNVPTDKALANGQLYYARVFAFNEIGYSLPQVSATAQKPMVVPGAPTSVVLSVLSETELRVVFNPPADDGGDAITSYKVEYSVNSDFSNAQFVLVTYLEGGAPFMKTISGLTTGVAVYVRVSAYNSQGFGDFAASVPSNLNPYQAASAPTDVRLRVTSDTMLTVSFSPPANDGGDPITGYRVEWDTTPLFNGAISVPNKGFVDLAAARFSSYTIQYLTRGQVYYVRVFAINSAGLGNSATASPVSAAPALQVPGKPHTISASTGFVAGQITLSWQRPKIPAHGIPCSGLVTAPNDCPRGVDGGLPLSNGGSTITEYEVNYNDLEDFSGFDSGEFTTSNTFFTLSNLTPDRLYYIRVLARNAQGAGQFCRHTDPNCLIVSTTVSATAKAASLA